MVVIFWVLKFAIETLGRWTWLIDMFVVGFFWFQVWKWWHVNEEIYNHKALKEMM